MITIIAPANRGQRIAAKRRAAAAEIERFRETYPAELLERRQWILHRRKKPLDHKGKIAKWSDPTVWLTFEHAARLWWARPCEFDGLGFVVTDGDPYTALDLDHCVDATGEILPWARSIVHRVPGLWTFSPGSGLRGFVRATKITSRCRFTYHHDGQTGDLEVYERGRFMRLTARPVPGSVVGKFPGPESQDGLDRLLLGLDPGERPEAKAERERRRQEARERQTAAGLPPDDERLRSIIEASLWRTPINLTDDASANDFRLAVRIAWFVGPDAGRVHRLCEVFGLGDRPKWYESRGPASYGELTIRRAIETLETGGGFCAWDRPHQEGGQGTNSGRGYHQPAGAQSRREMDLRPPSAGPDVALSICKKTLCNEQILSATSTPRRRYQCRRAAVWQVNASDDYQRRLARYPCRCRTCPDCAPTWLEERSDWAAYHVRHHFDQAHVVVADGPKRVAAIKRRIQRHDALYIRLPQEGGGTVFVVSIAFPDSQPLAVDDDLRDRLRDMLRSVPTGSRVDASRRIRFVRLDGQGAHVPVSQEDAAAVFAATDDAAQDAAIRRLIRRYESANLCIPTGNGEALYVSPMHWERDQVQIPLPRGQSLEETAEAMRQFVSSNGLRLERVVVQATYNNLDQATIGYQVPGCWSINDTNELGEYLHPEWHASHNVIVSRRPGGGSSAPWFGQRRSRGGILLDATKLEPRAAAAPA